MKIVRPIVLSLLFVFSVLAVSHAVSTKGNGTSFSLSNSPVFDLEVSFARVSSALTNFAHIKGFFIMSLLALVGLSRKKILGATIFVLALTMATELLQAWSPTRHARVTDAIPNFLGLGFGILIYWLAGKLSNKKRPAELALQKAKQPL